VTHTSSHTPKSR